MTKIVLYPDKILSKKCEPVTEITPEIVKICQDIREYLQNDPNAAGLSAPQIGSNKQIFGFKTSDNNIIIAINPIIHEYSQSHDPSAIVTVSEGCLSFPGITLNVTRSSVIAASYMDLTTERTTWNLDGFDAIVFQHEYDHLNGLTFVDRQNRKTRRKLIKTLKKEFK